MAIDKPCSFGCGRWARLKSDICEVCAGNRSLHKGHRPAQRMKYRQRLGLATRRQATYAEEFGDKKEVEEIEMIEKNPPKAKVIQIGPHIRRRNAKTTKRKRA